MTHGCVLVLSAGYSERCCKGHFLVRFYSFKLLHSGMGRRVVSWVTACLGFG